MYSSAARGKRTDYLSFRSKERLFQKTIKGDRDKEMRKEESENIEGV